MAKQTTQKANAEQLRVNEKKWTKPLMDAGWSVLPNIIIEKQAALGLHPLDMNIILHLVQYWWVADNLPHPSVATIAEAIGVTPRTIQKRIKALGLMEREERRHTKYGSVTNLYSFEGIIKAVAPFAEEKLAKKVEAQAAEKARIKSKKTQAGSGQPALTVSRRSSDG